MQQSELILKRKNKPIQKNSKLLYTYYDTSIQKSIEKRKPFKCVIYSINEKMENAAKEVEQEFTNGQVAIERPDFMTDPNIKGHDKIYDLLIEKDNITWQTIIHDLVRTEKMDPWDVDVSLLTQKYIEVLRQLKAFDFRVTGKVLLCAAMLLKIKSSRLVNEDIAMLDKMMQGADDDDFYEEFGDLVDENVPRSIADLERSKLIPRTPQPRKRKVSIYDLVDALEQALEVKRRRVLKNVPTMNIDMPKKSTDITITIKHIYYKILKYFSLNNRQKHLTFTQLLPSMEKEDKVMTFIPLLHLTNQRRIDLHQQESFGEIQIELLAKREIQKELGVMNN